MSGSAATDKVIVSSQRCRFFLSMGSSKQGWWEKNILRELHNLLWIWIVEMTMRCLWKILPGVCKIWHRITKCGQLTLQKYLVFTEKRAILAVHEVGSFHRGGNSGRHVHDPCLCDDYLFSRKYSTWKIKAWFNYSKCVCLYVYQANTSCTSPPSKLMCFYSWCPLDLPFTPEWRPFFLNAPHVLHPL